MVGLGSTQAKSSLEKDEGGLVVSLCRGWEWLRWRAAGSLAGGSGAVSGGEPLAWSKWMREGAGERGEAGQSWDMVLS